MKRHLIAFAAGAGLTLSAIIINMLDRRMWIKHVEKHNDQVIRFYDTMSKFSPEQITIEKGPDLLIVTPSKKDVK